MNEKKSSGASEMSDPFHFISPSVETNQEDGLLSEENDNIEKYDFRLKEKHKMYRTDDKLYKKNANKIFVFNNTSQDPIYSSLNLTSLSASSKLAFNILNSFFVFFICKFLL